MELGAIIIYLSYVNGCIKNDISRSKYVLYWLDYVK